MAVNKLEDIVKFREDHDIGWRERNTVTIDVKGGMCEIEFVPDISTGGAPRGVCFDLIGQTDTYRLWRAHNGKYRSGGGVMTRVDATRLRDMLTAYLEHVPCAD